MRFRIVLGTAVLAALAGCQAKTPPASPVVPVVAPSSDSPEPAAVDALTARKLDPRDVWTAALPRFAQADRESADALDARQIKIREYLTERAKGTRTFAEAVLSTEGKLLYTGGLAEQAYGAVAELFGSKPAGPDSFILYVRKCYRENVLDQDQFQHVIDAAIAGGVGDIRNIESQFLVDLRADLGDNALELKGALPQMLAATQLGFTCGDAIDQAVEVAGKDMLAMIVSGAVSWVAGDAIGNHLTNENDSTLRKVGTNLAAGAAVDKAIEGAMAQAGYDPVAEAATKAARSLETAAQLIIEGDPQLASAFMQFLHYGNGHPDETVRAACLGALRAIEQYPNLGLRPRFIKLHYERSRARAIALYGHLFGADAALPEEQLHYVNPKTAGPAAEIIRVAEEWKAQIEGNRRGEPQTVGTPNLMGAANRFGSRNGGN